MKPLATYQKLRGGYYTPKPIADFLARWAIQTSDAEVLEPSCGDGLLLDSAVETLIGLGAEETAIKNLVQGIELDPQEALKELPWPACPYRVQNRLIRVILTRQSCLVRV
jgi:adenine-specific DNA-methyltransferase